MLFIGNSPSDQAALRKAMAAGAVRRVFRGVYTDDFAADAETLAREHFLTLIGRLLPAWRVSHSSAALLGPIGDVAFLSGGGRTYYHPIRFPGITIVRLPDLPHAEFDWIEAPTPVASTPAAEPETVRVRVSSALQTIFECLSTARRYPEKQLPPDRIVALIGRLSATDRARAEAFARRNRLDLEGRKFRELAQAADHQPALTLARSREFEIYYYHWQVGRLSALGNGEVRFEYDPDWRIPLSRELPLAETPAAYEGRRLPAFFENLLPEGWTESRLRTVFKLDAGDDVGLLATTQKYLSNLTIRQPNFDASRFAIDAHGDRLEAIAPDPLAVLAVRADLGPDPATRRLWLELRDRSAVRLSGVQPKLPVSVAGADPVTLRLGDLATPCTHLLKFQSPVYPHLVENEWATMELARRVGLPTPAVRRVALTGPGRSHELALLVERYDIPDRHALDRAAPDLSLILQEDACSVLLLPRDRKYATSLERVATGLVDAGLSRENLGQLLRHCAFSWIVGNGDLHAKNISILRRITPGRLGTAPVQNRVDYAPVYDLVNTRLPIRDDLFALPLGGKRNHLRVADFAAWAKRWRMHREEVAAALAVLASGVRHHLDEVLAASGLAKEDTYRYRTIVQRNLDRLGV